MSVSEVAGFEFRNYAPRLRLLLIEHQEHEHNYRHKQKDPNKQNPEGSSFFK